VSKRRPADESGALPAPSDSSPCFPDKTSNPKIGTNSKHSMCVASAGKAWARVQPNSTWIQQTRKLPHEDNTQTILTKFVDQTNIRQASNPSYRRQKAGSKDRRRRHAARRLTTYTPVGCLWPNGSQAGACIVLALHSRETSRVITKMHSLTRTFAEVRHTKQEMACRLPLTQYSIPKLGTNKYFCESISFN
jgi:hypothetical protein